MELNTRLETILTKVNTLKMKDRSLQLFGASSHRYQFNRAQSEQELQEFEQRFRVQLPEEYRYFLKQIGNGGAGPFYGVVPLENSLFDSLDYPDPLSLINASLDFNFKEAWNMDLGDCEDEDYSRREEEYYNPKWANGMLRISNFGCGVSMNIVVNGSEQGNIWVDDRCSDGGIYPFEIPEKGGRIGFFDWYDFWLDTAFR
jgi:hypothetical protein